MKKSLIALAVAATAGAAFAQSSVTLYGQIDVGYTADKKIKNNAGATVASQKGVTDGGYSGSRIGFRGEENLGGGIKAEFTIEQGISPTNAAMWGIRTVNAGFQYDGLATSTSQFDVGTAGAYSTGNNRQSFVGVSGPFGTVRAGYHYTNAYEIATLNGHTMTSEGVYGGQIAHLWGMVAAGGARANGITYMSPRISGVQAALQYGAAGGREDTEFISANAANGLTKDNAKRMSLRLDYLQGPLRVGYSYTKYEVDVSARAAVATNLTSLNGGTPAIVNTFNVLGGLTGVGASTLTASQFDTTLNQLAASYDFKVAKVGGTYNKGTKSVKLAPTPTFGTAPSINGNTAVGDYDFSSMALSGRVPVGKWAFTGGWNKASLENAGTKSQDLTAMQLGALYNFSARTIAYAYVGKWDQDAAATTTSTSATAARKGNQTIVGLWHSF